MSDTKNKWHAIALVAGILLIAVNLRVPFTSIAPVLPLIQNDFGLSASALGLLTSLPLLAFAAFSPLSASVARRFGIELHCWSFQRASCSAPQAALGPCTPVRY
ncbi:hypothetical protein [Pseudomonas fluorescens]|uniref:hypothetical protein n=1 Tax=Pseudomonas fluorescens TaxID=294 RepID=UPI001FCE3C30|nr:hypothetical protein [Pseudomonas fluorescens]